ncbi:MAG: IS200/IS605 family transposase [Luteolibacter sp.]
MSTFYSLNVHVVFSTKNREPHIMPTWRERFHGYMGGCLKSMGATPLAIGGTHDHMHLLIGIKPSTNLSDTIRELKKASTKWVHTEIRMEAYRWQEGYGAFSVSPGNLETVAEYVRGQEEHHRILSFGEELEAMLRKAGIPYDPTHLD